MISFGIMLTWETESCFWVWAETMLTGRIRKAATLTCGGVTLQLPWDLIGLTEFEQFQDSDTDTSML